MLQRGLIDALVALLVAAVVESGTWYPVPNPLVRSAVHDRLWDVFGRAYVDAGDGILGHEGELAGMPGWVMDQCRRAHRDWVTGKRRVPFLGKGV